MNSYLLLQSFNRSSDFLLHIDLENKRSFTKVNFRVEFNNDADAVWCVFRLFVSVSYTQQ